MSQSLLQTLTSSPWSIGTAFLCCLVFVTLLLIDRKKLQQIAIKQWESYLSAVQTSLHRLRIIAQALEQAKRSSKAGSLLPPSDNMDKIIRKEMEILNTQLVEIGNTRSHFSYLNSVPWRPFPPLQHEMLHLLELAHDRILDEGEIASHATEKIEKTMRYSLNSLRGRNQSMAQMLEELTKKYAELSGKWNKAKESDLSRAKGKMKEEAAAARLLSELESGLPAEELELRLGDVKEQTEQINNQLADPSCDDAQKRKLQIKRNWLQQVKRWWSIQYKVRQQEVLLLDVAENISSVSNLETRDRFEKWLNLRTIEDENEELRNRIGEKELNYRILHRQLESIDTEHLAMNTLLGKVARAKELESMPSQELKNLENAIERASEKFSHAELADKRIAHLERIHIDMKNKDQEQIAKINELEAQATYREKAFENERQEFKVSVGLLENALNVATRQNESIQSSMKKVQEHHSKLM